MTFEELLDQAIAMLERRGRVTYRALKRQFQLDDDVLEDLTAEIIKAQRLAIDEDGEVLHSPVSTRNGVTRHMPCISSARLGAAQSHRE